MALSDALFDNVPLNVAQPNPCSPAAPALPWTGLVIQAPTQVAYRPGKPVDGQFAAIPVCGFYRLPMSRLADGAPLTLVAINLKDGSRYAGPMIDVDPGLMEAPPPRPPVDPDKLAGMLSAAYFNPNLARYVALPAAAAVYRVHAEYGGAVSNAVQIAVVRR